MGDSDSVLPVIVTEVDVPDVRAIGSDPAMMRPSNRWGNGVSPFTLMADRLWSNLLVSRGRGKVTENPARVIALEHDLLLAVLSYLRLPRGMRFGAIDADDVGNVAKAEDRKLRYCMPVDVMSEVSGILKEDVTNSVVRSVAQGIAYEIQAETEFDRESGRSYRLYAMVLPPHVRDLVVGTMWMKIAKI